jgi:hypothetical protein
MARRQNPWAVPLFDAIAGLDTPDTAGIDDTAPLRLSETAPPPTAAPTPADEVPRHDLGRSPRRRRATPRSVVVAGTVGLLVATIAAGSLTRGNHSQPTPGATPLAAHATDAAETDGVASARPRSPHRAVRTRTAPRQRWGVSRVPRLSARSTAPRRASAAVGDAADEFAP